MTKLDFNDFKLRGYPPDYVWRNYAELTCYRLGIRQGGSLGQLSQAWDELRNLGCHYAARRKIIKAILNSKWQRVQDALIENASIEYSAWTPGRPEKVSLETKEGVFGIPFKKWSHGLRGNSLEEHTYFEVIVVDPEVLIPILKEQDVYSGKSFAGNDFVYLEIIDD